jgi:molecular chaperone GrpE
MVKKKRPEEEESGLDNHVEASDNKEYNVMAEDPGMGDVQEYERTPDEVIYPPSEVSSSDNTVSRERELEAKLAEMQDKYIRLSAEFDNYRKRTLREKMDLSKYATDELLLKLLPVMDDFDRAVSHMETSTDSTALKNGIDLIYVKFVEFLRQNGVREIETKDAVFDVDLHDAIAKVSVPEEEKKGRIIDVVQKGYYLQDKVIRHSKVVVGE